MKGHEMLLDLRKINQLIDLWLDEDVNYYDLTAKIMVEDDAVRKQFLNTLKTRIDHANRKALIKRANYYGSPGVRMMPASELFSAQKGLNNNTLNEQ